MNIGDHKGLDKHLIPGLEPNGVPSNLKDTVYPFEYNRFDQSKDIVPLGMTSLLKWRFNEVWYLRMDFSQRFVPFASEKGIVLVFDECTSGFRESFGGIHQLHGVEPDLAIFGKAIGNGYAITAIIGRRQFMEAAQSSFISSTFWTERIGPSAALKTLGGNGKDSILDNYH